MIPKSNPGLLIWAGRVLLASLVCVAMYIFGILLAEKYKNGEVLLQSLSESSTAVNVKGLEITTDSLNLDKIWEERDFRVPLEIRNRSEKDICILRFATSCECTGVTPSSLVVPAGERAALEVKIDLTHRSSHQLGVAVGMFI